MNTAIILLTLVALGICCIKITVMMFKDREWAMGSVLILMLIVGILAIAQKVWS